MSLITRSWLRSLTQGVSVLLLSAQLLACAPVEPSELNAPAAGEATMPTAETVTLPAPTATVVSGYPGLAVTPTRWPISPDDDPNVTPMPGERVTVGAIVDM